MPSTATCKANKEVEKTLKNEDVRKREIWKYGNQKYCYQKYGGKQKAAIGNYALTHGTSIALQIAIS